MTHFVQIFDGFTQHHNNTLKVPHLLNGMAQQSMNLGMKLNFM